MPIPSHDNITHLLPPHLGDPRDGAQVSPYRATLAEVCQRYGSSAERKAILTGFLDLRQLFLGHGVFGFQWLAGSFVDNIEALEGRQPNDIDVVTFVVVPNGIFTPAMQTTFAPLTRAVCKARYKVDHFSIALNMSQPAAIVEFSKFWYACFAHTRDSFWKGLVRVELNGNSDDHHARTLLGAQP